MAIILENIVKGFNEHLVVNKLNLTVNDGELFVLLGSSGSGKSTILRIIAGLLYPDEGAVFLNGKDVTNFSPQKRDAGFVFQNYAIFKNMSVVDNIEFGLKIRKVKRKERYRRSQMLLDLVGLSGLGTRFPNELSGGQRQRVALARALAYEPAVLLLDEPFGALDAEIRSQLRCSLKEIQRELKVTTILVTHDQEEAFELGDRIGVLEKGILVEVGTPKNLYYKPKKEFVAKFLGAGNVVVGRAEGGEIRLGTQRLPFPQDAPLHEEGAPVRLLFRPEMVKHQDVPFKDCYPIGEGTLKEIRFSGAINRLCFELETFLGTRPVMPALSYGQRFANVACSEPSDISLNIKNDVEIGKKQYLALSSYHVLEPSALKFITLVNDFEKQDGALTLGKELALSSHGVLSLFHSCVRGEALEEVQKNLKKIQDKISVGHLFHFDTKIRSGKLIKEFVREVQEGYYDVSLVDAPQNNNIQEISKLSFLTKKLLVSAGVPVLISNFRTLRLDKMLICTAGGEPGKTVIRFGARIARHLRNEVTLFHVLNTKLKEERERMNRYLMKSSLLFESYKLNCISCVENGDFMSEILNKVNKDDISLVVIGVPLSHEKEVFDLLKEIVTHTTSSVLIVPSI